MPLALKRIPSLSVVVAVTALLATTAWTAASAQSNLNFVCEDGDRFVVEFLEDHVRLRDGSGIFALAAVVPGKIYSDGRIVLHAGRTRATLERIDSGVSRECTIES
ncbi:hypothetical protein [Pseudazoarcus pumilus]|uniref:C-type lysozyme inhibitor domain-containing protein n=1 Tax=Pseudazoarcus pumilus TaxID=2067960 RepID=A0A2I6S756_9RHOO|nr:hypothetical protein [Pseudazoarcus pumilus]AUN95087.1 hypothetical protein C0099_09140 [Pseudazoarcus pumilus]